MSLKIKKMTTEKFINILFCSIFCFSLVMFSFNNIVRLLIGNTYYLDSLFVFFCYGIIILFSSKRMFSMMRFKNWIFLILLISLPLFMCTNNEVKIKILSQIVPYCVLAFLVGFSILNYEKLWQALYKCSWIIIVLSFFDTFILKVFLGTSHMLAYVVLLPECVLIIEFINNRKHRFMNIFGILISAVLLIQANSSGAIVAAICCSIVGILYVMKNYKVKFIILVLFLSILMIILFSNFNLIILYLITFLEKFSINLNVLDEIIDSGLSADIYRKSIFDYCMEYSKEHLLLGCGVGNDRELITKYTLVSQQSLVGNYPHNIFLELTMQFGSILGIILSLFLVIFLLRFLIRESNKSVQNISCVLVGMGFFPLLFSSSYIENPMFYLLISFAWARFRFSKKEQMLRIKNESNKIY